MINWMSTRGQTIPVEEWWLRIARDLVARDQNGEERNSTELDQLGKDLAKLQGRSKPWSRTVLVNFRDGKGGVTREFTEALCKMFSSLPPAMYFPRSFQESARMLIIRETYDVASTTARLHDSSIQDIASVRSKHTRAAESKQGASHKAATSRSRTKARG